MASSCNVAPENRLVGLLCMSIRELMIFDPRCKFFYFLGYFYAAVMIFYCKLVCALWVDG